MLEIQVLGGFEVARDGQPILIQSRPAQTLLAYLVLNAGTLHRREKLAGMLWPTSTEESARNNLRQALWRIRKALGPFEDDGQPYLIADNFSIGFNRDAPYIFDVATLEREPVEGWSLDRLAAAVRAYGGELLPGFYEDWIVLERERLRAEHERKLQMLVVRLLAEHRWAEVVDSAERWIASGEVPEPAYRALMVAYCALGDNASAESAYRRGVNALEDQLGVGPSEQTKELHDRLSISSPSPDELVNLVIESLPPEGFAPVERAFPAFLEVGAGKAEPETTTFVGRSRELTKLEGFLAEALAGRGSAVMITGEAGSGKTALMRRFASLSQDRQEELIVVSGSGNALTGIGDPYHPFREVLGMLAGDVEAKWAGGVISRQEAQRLWKLVPATVAALLDQGPDLIDALVPGAPLISRAAGQTAQGPSRIDSLQRALERNRLRRWETSLGQKDLFEQYTRVILELTRRYPILIILDDLQWADSNSLALLFHLSRRAGDARLLLLGASRLIGGFEDSSQAERMLADLLSEIRRNYGDSHIDLGRTQEEEGESFIDAILDTESNALDPAFRRELFRHTGANPLFTIELLRAMEARGDIVQDDDHLWTPGPSLDWRQLPAKVEGVIEERLNKIGDELREILRVAAVEGGSFTAEVISQVLRLEIRDLLRQLGGKLDRQYRLVEPLGSRHLAEARLSLYRFRHILFQKHIYGRLDPAEKAYLHEDVGRALETAHHGQSGEISVQLAWHFAEAGLARRAIDYLIQAAAQARRLSAFQESASHLRRALSLVDSLPRGNESLQVELDLQTALGVSLVGAAGYAADEVGKAYARGRELCLELGGSPQLFPVLYGLRTFHLVRAEYGSALEHGQQLLSIGQTQQDPELLVEAHQALGTNLFYLGDFQAAAQHLKRCLDLYDLDRDLSHAARFGQDPAVACLSYLALTSWLLGQTALAIQQRDKALQHAETIAHPFSMAFALCFAGLLFRLEGDADSARRCAGEAEALSTARGFPFWAAMASILQGTILADAGHKEGIQHIQTGLGAWAGGGSRLGRPYYLGLLAEALARWGEDTLALATVEEAIEESTRTGERLSLADLHRWRGIFLARSGRKADARRSLRQALEVAREQNSPLFEARAAMSLFKVLEGAEGSSEFLGEVIARLSPHLSYPELLEAQVMLKSDPE